MRLTKPLAVGQLQVNIVYLMQGPMSCKPLAFGHPPAPPEGGPHCLLRRRWGPQGGSPHGTPPLGGGYNFLIFSCKRKLAAAIALQWQLSRFKRGLPVTCGRVPPGDAPNGLGAPRPGDSESYTPYGV